MGLNPRVLKGGIVTMDAGTGAVTKVIPLQYNPDTVTRSLSAQASGTDSTDRSEALRLKGPAVETYTLDAELDLTDALEHPDIHPDANEVGLHPALAALDALVNPTLATLMANDALSRAGRLEILPMQAPLTLFVWSRQRIVPVRLTQLTITEEAFDTALNPIRAKVSLAMRVLTVNDLGFDHRGGSIFLSYLRTTERLAARGIAGSLGQLGITTIA
jgi:hypothetical protein